MEHYFAIFPRHDRLSNVRLPLTNVGIYKYKYKYIKYTRHRRHSLRRAAICCFFHLIPLYYIQVYRMCVRFFFFSPTRIRRFYHYYIFRLFFRPLILCACYNVPTPHPSYRIRARLSAVLSLV